MVDLRVPHLGTDGQIAVRQLPPIPASHVLALETKLDRTRLKRPIAAAYTVTAEDAVDDAVLHSTASTGITVTLPTDAAAGIPQEVSIPWRQYGTGAITFVPAAGATLVARGGTTVSNGRYSQGTVQKVAANTWLLSGDLVVGAAPPPTQDEPGVPTTVTTTAGDTTIGINWAPPATDGGSPVTGYLVTRNLPDWSITLASTARTYTMTNFTNGTAYTVSVAAVNAIGAGPAVTRTVTPVAPTTPTTPPTNPPVTVEGGFADFITAMPGLTHYYPLNNTYQLQDLKGTIPLSNTGGGVTFGSAGALFDGSTADYLTAPTSRDFSVRNTTNAVSFLVCVTFPTYAQPSQFHWMSKGYEASNNLEWGLRLYGDSNARRRNISNYYWNPDPRTDINGNPVPESRGSGAYIAPPEGGRTPYNAPAGAGAVGVEHILGFEFTYAGTNGYDGRCRAYYGSATANTVLCADRTMDADALITPQYTNGKLFIGKRGDSDGMVKATIRRVAFFNRSLSLTEWRNIRANMTKAEG